MRTAKRFRPQPRFNPSDMITASVSLQVRYGRRHGQPTETIRKSVRTAINEALDVNREPVLAKLGGGCLDHAEASFWMFRVMLDRCGVQLSDPRARERWHQLVMEELDEALTREGEPVA